MDEKKELQNKISLLQKQINSCTDDVKAIFLQKELIDLLKTAFQDKEFLAKLLKKE